ncbi:acyl-CoA dehydrogenase family protein [Streptomyces sp. M2CJ-2]|uniref:acyl-CoA dehydrogenase family protein n=1 Tax=Streptomyces sp. M2CJ-2 TaxID=2803948 RepID=UPI001927324E|nr:acyl-CoA dehydrogenase family protein [Streptomyces sp. M2CJ-2]MBL3668079.1 acyl-CoA dehydrogenase family protein [Streptomyces sp. M2CJ-2]
MRRTLFDEDHDAFRASVRTFVEREIQPYYQEWAERGLVDRELYTKAARQGLVGLQVPEEYGGAGATSYKFNAVFIEETILGDANLGSLRVHSEVCLPYLLRYCSPEQRSRWLPAVARGELVLALAITEPGTGSDVAGVRTTARRDGDHYVLNGAKTFITGGANADRVLVVCRTAPATEDDRRAGLSILVVDTRSPGFEVGRKLDKIGLRAQDTMELSFTDVRVPVEDLLGGEGNAFGYLAHNLAQERLTIAVAGMASAVRALELATSYAQERSVFGRRLQDFQNTKFVLAECATEIAAGQALVDQSIEALDRGTLTPADAARAKLFVSEMQQRVVDKCLQVHGGYGYINEYPIAGLYADARVTRIFGGTSEVMKSIIAKSLGL